MMLFEGKTKLSNYLLLLCLLRIYVCENSNTTTDEDQRRPELNILAFITQTGSEPSTGKTCAAAMQVLIDFANKRSNVLPNYRLKINFADESVLASKTPQNFIGYLDSFPANKLAPVVVGPSYSCNVVSGLVRLENMVQFTSKCGGPDFTANRKHYPNLYRLTIPVDIVSMTYLKFATTVGEWRQLAVVSSVFNVQEQLLAALIAKAIQKTKGIEIVYRGSVAAFDQELAKALLANRARVILILTVQIRMIIDFWCSAYKEGMHGSQFVYFASTGGMFRPNNHMQLPADCSSLMIEEQMNSTFWFGTWFGQSGDSDDVTTSLGYNLAQFEAALAKLLNNSKPPDFEDRFACHDSLLQAILALNETEAKLNKNEKTLSDFATDPQLVMKTLNQSAAESNFIGLRGAMRYSKRLENDHSACGVYQQIKGDDPRPVFKSFYTNVGCNMEEILDLSNYNFTPIEPIIWSTRQNRPPADLAQIQERFVRPPAAIFEFSVSLAASVTCLQIVVLSFASSLRSDVFWKNSALAVLIFFSCILVDVAAFIFVLPLTGRISHLICHLRIIFAFLGTCLLTGQVVTQLLLLREILIRAQVAVFASLSPRRVVAALPFSHLRSNPDDGRRRMVATPQWPQKVKEMAIKDTVNKMATTFVALVSGLLMTVILAIWMGGVAHVRAVEVQSELKFDDTTDENYVEKVMFCRSDDQEYWISGVLSLQTFLLLLASVAATQLHQMKTPDWLSIWKKSLSAAAVLGLTIDALAIFAYATLPVASLNLFHWQQVVVSLGLSLFSLVIFLSYLFPFFFKTKADIDNAEATDQCSKTDSPQELIKMQAYL